MLKNKSSWYSLKSVDYGFTLSGKVIPNGFVYLGLPVGGCSFVENFYSMRMTKCERALYSLNSIGCTPNKLHPHAIAFAYKQYCKSILKFGLEYV